MESVAFYIYTYKISVGKQARQPYGIFTRSASEFERDRVVIFKVPLQPGSL